jgi:hypothetical protein
MPTLTEQEREALAYLAIGVSSEGKDVAYQLSFAGQTIREHDGSALLKPVANSGYSIGTLQTDLGQHPELATRLVADFQAWAKTAHPDWVLSNPQQLQFTQALARDGREIRAQQGQGGAHTVEGTGPDIDQTFKSHLNDYLASDAGKSFVHRQDQAQVMKLMDAKPMEGLYGSTVYARSTPDEQAKIFVAVAKVYNQNEHQGRVILNAIANHQINSLADINKKIDTFPPYMRTGRDAALAGAEMFNTLQVMHRDNPLHAAWQDVLANPLIDPSQLNANAAQPHLADEYASVKALFVQPTQGEAMVAALEKGGSYNHGDPSHAHSRGFYAQGRDFVQWDRDGQGRAYVNDAWSNFSRNELVVTLNHDHTLDVGLAREGAAENLLHVTHPVVGHGYEATVSLLRVGARGQSVTDLQGNLHQLGYLDARGVDGQFGPRTVAAVERFQRDHGLAVDGVVGSITRQRLDAGVHDQRVVAASWGGALDNANELRAFSDPDHSRHAMYAGLKEWFPRGTSEARLAQATAACHLARMDKPEDLAAIYSGENPPSLIFMPNNLLGSVTEMDLSRPAPSVQQSVRQVQAFDQAQGRQWEHDPRQIDPQPQAQAQRGLQL